MLDSHGTEFLVTLSAVWTEGSGARVLESSMSSNWARALFRVAADLSMRQFNGSVARIYWTVHCDIDAQIAWLVSDITPAGSNAQGAGVSGAGACVDAGVDTVAVSMADLVQDQIARCGIAWPWKDEGGFLTARLVDGAATWTGAARPVAVGTLSTL